MSLLSELDRRAVIRAYRVASVSTPAVRAQLRRFNKPFLDPEERRPVRPEELMLTARWVIGQARQGATAFGGMAGVGGLATVPPEIVATAVSILRLGQRLTIVYGLDPQTDRGKMVLWRTLAAGLEIELPDRGPVGLSVRELVRTPTAVRTVGGTLAIGLLRRSTRMVAGRFFRHIPVVSSAVAAVAARRRIDLVAERMLSVLVRVAEPQSLGPVEDATEL